ncbi:transporter substrate-binding domain-containing protein [Collimonas sp. H4R21]|uniref:histidine kinase n=1 Tax=Collimonas rhizosphaerae TaxID=3126357 RepID=A0ABU9Q3J1_9BURK
MASSKETCRHLMVLMVLVLCCGTGAAVETAGEASIERLQLLDRPVEQSLNFHLSGADWRWLGKKRTLVLGTVGPPNRPPFDLTNNDQDFDGLTADYAALLAKHLGVSVEVRRYPTRGAANVALAKGDIDLLGLSRQRDLPSEDFALSRPYVKDRTASVVRIGEHRLAGKAGAAPRVAIVTGYLPDDEVRRLYPSAILTPFSSAQKAIAAVAYGQVDLFLGDAVSASYLINKSYFNDVQLDGYATGRQDGVGFAVQRKESVLLRVLDTVLQAIPEQVHESMLRRWGVGLDFRLSSTMPALTAVEQRWIAQHPKIKVLVSGVLAPVTFFDEGGQFNGVVSDYLRLVRLQTGLEFEVIRVDSIQEMVKEVRDGRADLIGSVAISADRLADIAFTRPYLINSFVLVTRDDGKPVADVSRLRGKKLAIQAGNPLVPLLRKQYPDVELVLTDYAMTAFEQLDRGQVDGAVQTQIVASYFISRFFHGKLHIAASIDDEAARLAMGVRRGEPELRDILNKVLLSVSPAEAIMLTNRWREKSDTGPSSWNTYRSLIFQIAGGAMLLILATLFWIVYLRRQIRKRHLAERALDDQLEFMRALIDGTPHPIYVRDLQARLIECNRSYLEAMGGEREDVMGKTLPEATILSDESAQILHATYLQTMKDGKAEFADRDIAFGQRSLKIYHWTLPFNDTRGHPAGMIGGWIDISEREELVNALQMAKDTADEANRAKSTFLATMSHEIRTPMNAIIGMLELVLKRGDEGRWDRQSITVAYDSAKTLLGLIGDILDIAKIESGKLELVPERANLRELVEAVSRVFDGLARQKGLTLRTFIDAEAGVDVLIDPMRFKQILSNLVSNAIKFTDEGQVTIRVDTRDDGDARLAVQLMVTDTGQGIAQDEQAKLFSSFVQVSPRNAKEAGNGTGLGLAISRKLAQMMGGGIELQSEPGVGTQVMVTFTVAAMEAFDISTAPIAMTARKSNRLRVLVVDDNVANRLVLCQQLEYLGHEVQYAEDGARALQIWRVNDVDLVMTDCNMPVMNGYQLAREIRHAESQCDEENHCVIWGYTANAQPQEVQRCKASGMNDCLFKPIGLDDLQRRLTAGLSHGVIDEMSMTTAPLFEVRSLEAMTKGNFMLMSKLANELIKSNRSDALLLSQRAATADWLAVSDVAHSIKGASTIVGGRILSDAAAELESLCRDGAAEADLRRGMSVVLREIARLEESLEKWLSAALPEV